MVSHFIHSPGRKIILLPLAFTDPACHCPHSCSYQVQMIAFIIVFMSSGLVPLDDILFALFTTVYSFLLARFAFPSPSPRVHAPPKIFSGSRFFKIHVTTGAVIGMFLPLSYVLGGNPSGSFQPPIPSHPIPSHHAASHHVSLVGCVTRHPDAQVAPKCWGRATCQC